MSNRKEIWKKIKFKGKQPVHTYVVSNHGRFGLMDKKGKVEVRTFQPQEGGYRYNFKAKGVSKALFVYKAVAETFVKGRSSKRTMIIRKDHNYLNDHADNLKWVTPEEHREHVVHSPANLRLRKKRAIIVSLTARKFDEESMKELKRLIWDPKRKFSLKQIAKKYKVSEMQIYRIKRGEIWFHVRVAGEPEHKRWKENLANIEYHKKLKKKAGKSLKKLKRKK